MRVFGFEITRRTKAAVAPLASAEWNRITDSAGWFPVLREAFAGAWQRGVTAGPQDVLSHSTFWACLTLIAQDISKLRIKLVAQDSNGIWDEVENSSYSPVLRKPNHYQTRIKFLEQWVLSKLIRGNAYILKERDGSRKVRALYPLDPTRVNVLVSPNGDVFYQLATDNLSGLYGQSVTVPASEIIHDVYLGLYHPLCGVSPIYACGQAAMQGQKILSNTHRLFENGSQPGGVLTAPGTINPETAKRIQEHWDNNFSGQANIGKVAVLGDGLKYEPLTMTAVDAQLIDQLKWGDERICSVLHVPPYKVGVGPMPSYNNVEALDQSYYAQGLQNLIECIELLLDEGLELPKPYGTELDVEDGLLRMDTATRVKAAGDAIGAGMAINEARKRYYGLGPVKGGETPYLQEQNWPVRLLAERELPSRAPTEPAPIAPPPQADKHLSKRHTALLLKAAVLEKVTTCDA